MDTKNPIFIPFEQNNKIIKDFFKTPIILIVMIFQALYGTCFLVSFTLNHFVMSVFKLRFSFVLDLLSIGLYISMVVGYLLVYIKSKDSRPTTSPKIGFTLLFVTTIAKALLTVGNLIISLDFFRDAASWTYQIREWLDGPSKLNELLFMLSTLFTMFVLLIIAVIAIVMLMILLFYITQMKFFHNVSKNLTSVMLNFKGATAFATLNIVMFIIIFFAIPSTDDQTSSVRALAPSLTKLMAGCLFISNAIMAIQYKKYIKKTITVLPATTVGRDSVTAINVSAPVYPSSAPMAYGTQNVTVAQYTTYSDLQRGTDSECPYCKGNTPNGHLFCANCGRRLR